MQRKKTLLLISNITNATALLSVLIAAVMIDDKKKLIYATIGLAAMNVILAISLAILLAKETKHEKLERSDSSLSLSSVGSIENDSDSEDEIEVDENNKKLTHISTNDNNAVSENKVADSKKIKKKTKKGYKYCNLMDKSQHTKSFGKDESVIAVTFPENYSIKKYENGREIQNTKNDIISNGDKYKPIDFSVKEINKKEDSYQFVFKFQNMQKDNTFIELTCNVLNVYSGWKENEQKPVTKYFKDLKANDDFLIFLDVKKIFSEFLGKVLKFAQKVFPANDQGLSSVTGEDAYKHFKLKLLQEESPNYIHIKGKFPLNLLDKKFPIKDILVSDQLIHKEQKIEQEHQNDVDQNTQVVEPINQTVVITHTEIHNIPKEEHIEVLDTDSVPPSPSTSSGIASESASTSDITATESKEEHVEEISSRSFAGSKESVDSAGKSKKKSTLKLGLKSFKKGISEVGDKIKSKLKKDKNIKSKETSPSSSVSALSAESAAGQDNPSFMPD